MSVNEVQSRPSIIHSTLTALKMDFVVNLSAKKNHSFHFLGLASNAIDFPHSNVDFSFSQ